MSIYKEVKSIQGRIEEYVEGENRNHLQDLAMVKLLMMLYNIVLNQKGKIVAETVKFVDELCGKTNGIIQKTAFDVLRELVNKKEGFNNIREQVNRVTSNNNHIVVGSQMEEESCRREAEYNLRMSLLQQEHEEKMRETLEVMKQKQKQSDVQIKTKGEKLEKEKELDIQIANMSKEQKEREEKAREAKNEEMERKRKREEEEDKISEEDAKQIDEMLLESEDDLEDMILQIEQNLFNI
ncbi:PREDICTED: glutamic acid-rich protein-like [Nicrophorus vespilloides]|uniref:Glutamic acid-rich protein-like n=1 Tax=Nicrophorus vespilloides TaxID=110193 RepID=A0ABM1N129_NICVS|nr:PREDICTED: glutamic acid-rich protein-like [Nicrophorus vespilloides]